MQVRKMRISKNVLFDILDALRNEKEISVKHSSFDFNKYETSHIAALLEKASLVKITGIRPITLKSINNWNKRKNENIWKYLTNKTPSGTKLYTPARHKLNIILTWKDDKVEYFSGGSGSPKSKKGFIKK